MGRLSSSPGKTPDETLRTFCVVICEIAFQFENFLSFLKIKSTVYRSTCLSRYPACHPDNGGEWAKDRFEKPEK